MTEAKSPIRLAGSVLNRTRHACAFFSSREEEYEVLMPFMKDGFECGDRQCHIVDPEHRPERLRRLSDAGIDTHDSRVDVRAWAGANLSGDRFDKDAMLGLVREAMQGGKGSAPTGGEAIRSGR